MSNPNKSNPLAQAWLVLLLAVVYGAGLAFVHSSLSSKIAENVKNETYSLIPVLVGNPTQHHVEEQPVVLENGQKTTLYCVRDDSNAVIGWVIPAAGQGFAENIGLLIGVDAGCDKILGMRVIEQKETPGLGNLIQQPAFRDQFEGKATAEKIEVVKAAPAKSNEIRAVTGATISSRAVADAVNSAIGLAKPLIQKTITQ